MSAIYAIKKFFDFVARNCAAIFVASRAILTNRKGQMTYTRTKIIKRPALNAGFAEWIDYYIKKQDLSQSELARRARINQPTVNKLVHGKCERTSMEIFVAVMLVLQLSDVQAKDLLSRVGRAFSPCDERHQRYLKLIAIYHFKNLSDVKEAEILDDADKYLKKYGFDPLPNSP